MFNSLITQPLGRLLNRPQASDVTSLQPADTVPMGLRGPKTLQFAMTQPGDTAPVPAITEPRSQQAAARRPLASVGGVLAGFEFSVDLPSSSRTRLDSAAARARTTALLRSMRPCVEANQVALAEVPASWLALCLGDGLFLRGMYLVLGADALFDDADTLTALTSQLRDQGVMLGWRLPAHAHGRMPPGRPDFLPVTAAARASGDSWRQAVADGARLWPDVPQVLLDIASVDLLDAMLAPPVALAACMVGVCDEPAQPVALPRVAERLLNLLGLVAHDRSGKHLAALMKSDPEQHQFLLQGLNALAASSGRQFPSVDRALATLGRDRVHHLLARLLVQQAPQRPAAATLRLHALARARLTELLAAAASEPDPSTLYLTGLASMLPQLLRCTVDDALAPLRLPPEAITALAEQAGPWMHYATLIRALERHDLIAAEGLSQPFGGLQAVLSLSQEAWRNAAG